MWGFESVTYLIDRIAFYRIRQRSYELFLLGNNNYFGLGGFEKPTALQLDYLTFSLTVGFKILYYWGCSKKLLKKGGDGVLLLVLLVVKLIWKRTVTE